LSRDPSFNAVRRYYEDGGFVDAPEPKEPSDRMKRLMALYGSQHYADGGDVEGYSDGGKFSPIIKALKESVARSVRTPDNTYRTSEAIDKINNLWGLNQARRLEEAADRGVDLSYYTPRALERATNPEAGHLFTTMHPSKFQDFAAKIPEEFLKEPVYRLAERTGTLDQILQNYSDVAKMPGASGWNDIPKLGIGISQKERSVGVGEIVPPFRPETVDHNGRHRSMSLARYAPLDIAPDSYRSLVSLEPRGWVANKNLANDAPPRGVFDALSKTDDLQERLRQFLAQYDNKLIPEPPGIQPLHNRNLTADTLPQLETPFARGGEVPGYANAGKVAIQWMKDLLGYATPNERKAVQDVSQHMATKGHEANVTGESLGRVLPLTSSGFRDSVMMPPGYADIFRGANGTPVFTAHAHPNMDALPSSGDWRVWGNADKWGGKDPVIYDPNFARQDSWISIPEHGPSAHTLIPALENSGDISADVAKLRDILARQRASEKFDHDGINKLFGLSEDFSLANNIPLGNSDDMSKLFSSYQHAMTANNIAGITPIIVDPASRISPHTGLTAGEVWPELFKYMSSKGYNPLSANGLAHGGEVPGYADAGKVIKPGLDKLIQYMRGISQPVQAHHASPHDFLKFKSSQIGTGEGNRDFGEGLYFAENPAVAAWYRKNFGGDAAHMYDVNIHEDPSKFLSLDTPLNEQGILGLRAADFLQAPKDWILRPPTRQFPRMQDQVSSPDFARFLVGEGGAGTRYFDSKSLARGHGTQNYVVAPGMDDILEITNKYADGGDVPGYSSGAVVDSLGKAFRPLMEYLGGAKRAPKESYRDWWHPHVDSGTTIPYNIEDELLRARNGEKEFSSQLSDDDIARTLANYTAQHSGSYNRELRHFVDNKWKTQYSSPTPDSDYTMFSDNGLRNLNWWRAPGEVPRLAKFLQDNPVELPYDIYRGGRMRAHDLESLLGDSEALLHGRGFGSFSFDPMSAEVFKPGNLIPPGNSAPAKVPYFARIPKGTEVRGVNAAPHSENRGETEFLLAPFQGYSVKDVNILKRKLTPEQIRELGYDNTPSLLLDIVPSGIFDPFSPAIHRDGGEVNGYANGGDVPGYSGGGAQIMRKGFDAALQPVLEYLGGLKRNTIPYDETHTRGFNQHYPTAYTHDPNDNWKTAMDKGRFPYQPDIHPDRMTARMTSYTSSDYHDFNKALREFASNPNKELQDDAYNFGNEWWRTGKAAGNNLDYREDRIYSDASELAKYLQDMEYELPFDIFRGARIRANPSLLSEATPGQVHGRGFGSFTFRPDSGLEWGMTQPHSSHDGLYDYGSQVKVPSTLRIPQGTKVRGANVMPYSEMDNEFEMLLAPFQGFDVKDVNIMHSPGSKNYGRKDINRLLLDIEPSGIYDPFSPAIYRDGGEVEGYSGGGKYGELRSYLGALRDILKKPITVGVDENVLPKVVADGRFKSQFETGRSNGSYEPDYRAQFERKAFGLPLDLPPHERPIYGHIADRDTFDTARTYGNWGAVLDPRVNERSTFYFGDSLGSAPEYGPYPFKSLTSDPELKDRFREYMRAALDGYKGDLANFTPRNLKGFLENGDVPGHYVEAQIQGGLPWNEVRALVSKKEYGHPDDAAAALHKIAQIANRPAFAPWSKFDAYDRKSLAKAEKAGVLHPDTIGDLRINWMRADPHEDLNAISGVPASALGEFGYEDGGDVRHLMTGYAGQFYNDGGDVPGYQTGGKLGKVASILREALGPLNKAPATDDFVYHATSKNRLNDIAEQGLKTHWPYEFTDQGSWPDGRITKRAYFASSPDIASNFAPADDGPTAFLRTYLDPRHISRESGTGDYFSEKLVPRERLEYLNDDGTWNPLKMWGTPK